MILDIGKGWSINYRIQQAELWGPGTVLNPKGGKVIEFSGPSAIEDCLDEFRAIMEMTEAEIAKWQQ